MEDCGILDFAPGLRIIKDARKMEERVERYEEGESDCYEGEGAGYLFVRAGDEGERL